MMATASLRENVFIPSYTPVVNYQREPVSAIAHRSYAESLAGPSAQNDAWVDNLDPVQPENDSEIASTINNEAVLENEGSSKSAPDHEKANNDTKQSDEVTTDIEPIVQNSTLTQSTNQNASKSVPVDDQSKDSETSSRTRSGIDCFTISCMYFC